MEAADTTISCQAGGQAQAETLGGGSARGSDPLCMRAMLTLILTSLVHRAVSCTRQKLARRLHAGTVSV